MSFNNLTTDTNPVKSRQTLENVFNCSDFTGELSSVTGINSKFMYIDRLKSKINGDVESLPPTVHIVCGPECKESCINLFRKNEKKTS